MTVIPFRRRLLSDEVREAQWRVLEDRLRARRDYWGADALREATRWRIAFWRVKSWFRRLWL